MIRWFLIYFTGYSTLATMNGNCVILKESKLHAVPCESKQKFACITKGKPRLHHLVVNVI